MTSIEFIHSFGVFSREGSVRPASKSEVRRWLEAGSVACNGERLGVEQMDFPIGSLVLFPRGKRVTLL